MTHQARALLRQLLDHRTHALPAVRTWEARTGDAMGVGPQLATSSAQAFRRHR
jgi:hypothetical protein